MSARLLIREQYQEGSKQGHNRTGLEVGWEKECVTSLKFKLAMLGDYGTGPRDPGTRDPGAK